MSEHLNRRDFIAQSTLAGTAAGWAVSAAGESRADDSPANKVVLGVMGLSRGRNLAVRFARLSGVEVKYVCDVDSTRVSACAATLVEHDKGGAVFPKDKDLRQFDPDLCPFLGQLGHLSTP